MVWTTYSNFPSTMMALHSPNFLRCMAYSWEIHDEPGGPSLSISHIMVGCSPGMNMWIPQSLWVLFSTIPWGSGWPLCNLIILGHLVSIASNIWSSCLVRFTLFESSFIWTLGGQQITIFSSDAIRSKYRSISSTFIPYLVFLQNMINEDKRKWRIKILTYNWWYENIFSSTSVRGWCFHDCLEAN